MIFMIRIFDDGMVAAVEAPRQQKYIQALNKNGFNECDGKTYKAALRYMVMYDGEETRLPFNEWLKDEL